MNLVFLSREQYPDGGAATNRHIAYAKGLVELGHCVTFILLSEQSTDNFEFNLEGIVFICANNKNSDYRRANRHKKFFNQFYLIKKGIRIIKDIHNKRKIDAMILLTTWAKDLFPFIYLAKNHGIKLLHERTEYPFVDLRNTKDKLELKLSLIFILRKFDGIYVISNALKNYINKCVNGRVPIEIINMIVDPARFKKVVTELPFNDSYIAYCGKLNSEKDGVDILVEAFAKALKNGKIPPDIKLLLIGDYENEDFSITLEEVIRNHNCFNSIIFTGKVKRDEIPDLLNQASALALARPDNKQAEGGFPTKLGEYLATGKPVIITDVGEIGAFLKDGFNAFIAKPGDVDDFSEKIAEVFSDYKSALKIGSTGKILVENDFNYLKQAEKLAHFIERK